VKCLDNRIKPRRCSIDSVSFSAHVDYQQNQAFIKSVTPDYIILVHGEKTQMSRLKGALENEIHKKNNWPNLDHKPTIAIPENCVKVKLRFRKNILANVIGSTGMDITRSLENAASSSQSRPSATLASLNGKTILFFSSFVLITLFFTGFRCIIFFLAMPSSSASLSFLSFI
jgi:hypothetical protein